MFDVHINKITSVLVILFKLIIINGAKIRKNHETHKHFSKNFIFSFYIKERFSSNRVFIFDLYETLSIIRYIYEDRGWRNYIKFNRIPTSNLHNLELNLAEFRSKVCWI